MKAYIYGQAPGKRPKEDPSVPFVGGPHGRFLAELSGVHEDVFYDLFTFRNVLDYYPGQHESGKGDAFPMDEARARARDLREEWEYGDTILLAGWNVKKAFEIPGNPGYLRWVETPEGAHLAVIPHPSRVSRYWNDNRQVEKARAFMTRAVHEVMMLHPEYEGGMLV